MRQRTLMTVFALLIITTAIGQNFEKIVFNDRDAEDYYIQLNPPTEKINGVLILLPGYAEKPESIFPSSNLFNTAYANDIWTIAIAGGEKIYADEKIIDKLNRGLSYFIKKKPKVPKDKFIIGGFSAGGTISLRYAEYSIEHPAKTPIILKGIFAVDSPIDLFDIREYFQREIKKNYSEAGVFEARFISEKMNKEIGTPETNPKRYNELTPFNHRMMEEGNEKYLRNMAVRVYHDIDIVWQLKQREKLI